MKYGTRVKELCKQRKITVAEVERLAGIPAKSISSWDKSVPSFDKVEKVIAALGVSYEEFANIGSVQTQTIQSAFAQIKKASPEVYEDIMRGWREQYSDDTADLAEELQLLRDRPDLRSLLHAGKKNSPEKVRKVSEILELMEEK